MTVEWPWPEEPAVVERRLRAMVASVVRRHELRELRIEWVTPMAHRFDDSRAGWCALRVTIVAIEDESLQMEIWGPDWWCDWDRALDRFAQHLEDWACRTSFAWGQQRICEITP